MLRSSFWLVFFVVACGGATDEPTATPATSETSSPPETPPPGRTNDSTTDSPKGECASPAEVIAKNGSTIRQPVGSVQRFQLVYQGSDVGVTALRGVDMIIHGSDGPFSAGTHSGYWAEVRDASGATTFTRLLQDPTRVEAPNGNGGFTNGTVDKCIAKTILVDVPRAQPRSVLVIFGNPYGQSTAGELARFTLE